MARILSNVKNVRPFSLEETVFINLPGGRLEQPVVNCKKAFLSAAVKLTSTLTNLRKAAESRV